MLLHTTTAKAVRSADMRRRRDERDADERGRLRSDEPERRPDPAETMLALQRSAGNRAVSALVARTPDDMKKGVEKAEGASATLEGIGTIPILSVSFPPARAGTGGSGGDREQSSPHELVLTSKVGEHSASLVKAAGDGRQMTVEIVVPGKGAMLLKLTGAIVASYQTSGRGPDEMESWTLNFKAIERTTEEAEGEKP